MRLLLAFVLLVPVGEARASSAGDHSTPIHASFTDESLAKALTAMGDTAGVRIIFDVDYRDKRLTMRFDGESFDDALAQVLRTQGFFAKPLGDKVLVVAHDMLAKRYVYDRWQPTRPFPFVGKRDPITLSFTDEPLRSVFQALGDAAGVKFVFDEAYRDRRVSVRFENDTFESALDQLVLPNRLYVKPIEGDALVVALDSNAIRQKYEKTRP